MKREVFESDVLVVGGGVSGVVAAVTAARNGASVILFEREVYLGGIAVGAMMGQFVGCGLDDVSTFCGIPKEIVDTMLRTGNAKWYPMPARTRDGNILLLHYNVDFLGKLLEDMIRDAGVRVFYNTQLLEAKEEELGCVVTALGVNSYLEFQCSYAIDATGTAALVDRMGFPTRILPVEKRMPSGLMFRMSNICLEEFNDFNWVKVRKPWFSEGILPAEHLAISVVPNTNDVIVNATNYCPFDEESPEDVARVEMELQTQIQRMVPIFKEKIPGFQNASLTAIAKKVGVREARRIVGDYVLSVDEILQETKFEDVIGVGAWPVDRNLPDGSNIWTETRKPYQIPFRVMLPGGSRRVLTAGRSFSVDDDCYSATRVIPTTMAVGQAAGFTAALAMKMGVTVNQIDGKKVSEALKACGNRFDW